MARRAGPRIQGLPNVVVFLVRHVGVFADGSRHLEGMGEPQKRGGCGFSDWPKAYCRCTIRCPHNLPRLRALDRAEISGLDHVLMVYFLDFRSGDNLEYHIFQYSLHVRRFLA